MSEIKELKKLLNQHESFMSFPSGIHPGAAYDRMYPDSAHQILGDVHSALGGLVDRFHVDVDPQSIRTGEGTIDFDLVFKETTAGFEGIGWDNAANEILAALDSGKWNGWAVYEINIMERGRMRLTFLSTEGEIEESLNEAGLLSTTFVNDHRHKAALDAKGYGETTEDAGHNHVVVEFDIQPSPGDGHTHEFLMGKLEV